MQQKKRPCVRSFWRAFFMTGLLTACLLGGLAGAARAYENTVRIGFGKEQHAFALTDEGLRVFDFVIRFGQAGE